MTPYLVFILTHRTWYAGGAPFRNSGREIMFQARENDANGAFLYEFAVREHDHRSAPGGRMPARVEVFQDAWDAFADFPDLFTFLASLDSPTFDDVVNAIAEVYEDVTAYVKA